MKKILIFLLLPLLTFAQSPEGFNYSAVIRDAQGNIEANVSVSIEISILVGTSNGLSIYTETHSLITDAYGVISLLVGSGNVQSGAFNNISWSSNPHFLKVGVDINGGSNYNIVGTTQIMSVPYALHSKLADSALYSNVNEVQDIADVVEKGNDANSKSIYNIKSISIGSPDIDTSAALAISSANQGLLPPRMSEVQRDAIYNPAAGLMVWCTDCGLNGLLSFYDGSVWKDVQFSNPSGTVPTVSTDPITTFGFSSATVGGSVTLNGGAQVQAKGICYSKTPNPNTTDFVTPTDTGNGSMSYVLTNLDSNTTYYVRAFAQNQNGTGYGSLQQFTTKSALSVGDTFGGGIVAYILQLGDYGYIQGEQHGIIIAEADLYLQRFAYGPCSNSSNPNGNYPSYDPSIFSTDTTKTNVGLLRGIDNMQTILNACNSTMSLPYVVSQYSLNGYNDWIVPTQNDLLKIRSNYTLLNNSLSTTGRIQTNSAGYWSSTIRSSSSGVFYVDMGSLSTPSYQSFSTTKYLRPVRYF